MKIKPFLLSVILSFILFQSTAQGIKAPDELKDLRELVRNYITTRDTATMDRKTEFILMFLDVDSSGKIININFMTDEKNRDQTFRTLKEIKPVSLNSWTSILYKNKVIAIPIFTKGSGERNYLDKIEVNQFISTSQRNLDSKYNIVISSQLFYYWPTVMMGEE